MSLNGNNTFYKTFTGVDTLAFAIFPNTKPILLGSVTTISHSMYREKRPVPLIGKINTGGYTRGMRSIAGTIIFTLINQHFVRDLVEQIPYLKEHDKIKSDELPFFDILIIAANEYGSNSKMMIYGIDLFEEGQVLSVQDMYIENTLSFVARDIDEFGSSNPIISGGKKNNHKIERITMNSGDNISRADNKYSLDEISALQKKIFKNYVSGVYDTRTYEKVKEVQKEHGLTESGYLDNITYDVILNNKNALKVITKKRVFVKDEFENEIIGITNYGDAFIYTIEDGKIFIDFYGKKGIIEEENVSFLNRCDTFGSISILKYNINDIKDNSLTIKLNCNGLENTIKTMTKYNGSSCYNVLTTNKECCDLLEEMSNAFLYNPITESYPEVIEAVVVNNNNKVIKKYVFNLGGVKWQ